jgi:hypothetical protein
MFSYPSSYFILGLSSVVTCFFKILSVMSEAVSIMFEAVPSATTREMFSYVLSATAYNSHRQEI